MCTSCVGGQRGRRIGTAAAAAAGDLACCCINKRNSTFSPTQPCLKRVGSRVHKGPLPGRRTAPRRLWHFLASTPREGTRGKARQGAGRSRADAGGQK